MQFQPHRQSATNALAVVGFIALLVLGVWAAVYSSRYVPVVVNKIGAAAVYLGSAFSPSDEPTPPAATSTEPTATSTVIVFGTPEATTTPSVATTTTVAPKPAAQPTYYRTVATTVPAAPVQLYGKSDLVVTVSQIGYLRTASTDSFVASREVPDGERPAVKFTVKNIGTNATGEWRFSAKVPTRTAYTYRSNDQQSINPDDSIDYVLGFDRARSGDNREMEIVIDYSDDVDESNESNNSVEVEFDIE